MADRATLMSELRDVSRDVFNTQWSDSALDRMIDEGLREYSLLSDAYVGEMPLRSVVTGVLRAPADFISPIRVLRADGTEVPIVSWRFLDEHCPDFRKRTGERIEYACFDWDTHGSFRLFPQVQASLLDQLFGKLIYRRFANKGDKLGDAVKAHVLYQMAWIAGKGSVGDYYDRFMDEVNEKARSQYVTANRKPVSIGRYF